MEKELINIDKSKLEEFSARLCKIASQIGEAENELLDTEKELETAIASACKLIIPNS